MTTNLSGTNWVNDLTNNIAVVPCTTTNSVTVNTIRGGTTNAAGSGAFVDPTNAVYYVDNYDPSFGAVPPYLMEVPAFNTQYDGMTILLVATTALEAGVTNHVKIAIADYTDSAWDSAVFLESWSERSCPDLGQPGSGGSTSSTPPIPL